MRLQGEAGQLPDQQEAKSERQQIEQNVRSGAQPRRQARLHELHVVVGAIDLTHRQTEESNSDNDITAEFLGRLEGEAEQVAGDDLGQYHQSDGGDADFADQYAASFKQRRPGMEGVFGFLAGEFRIGVVCHCQRPTAARISFRIATASALWWVAHSSQYGRIVSVASLMSSGEASVSTMPSLPNCAVTSFSTRCISEVAQIAWSAAASRRIFWVAGGSFSSASRFTTSVEFT